MKKWPAWRTACLILLIILLVFALIGLVKSLNLPQQLATTSEMEAQAAVADEGRFVVLKSAGEAYYPDARNWTYHFTYAYPRLEGEGYTAALINDTFEMALNEVKEIALPMFAGAQEGGGRYEVNHDFEIKCNTDKLLSVLLKKSQTDENDSAALTLEAEVFNVFGDSAGDTLTLRGAALIQAGADPENLSGVTVSDLPAYPGIVNGSSDQMEEALLPLLYREFQALQEAGAARADADYEEYEAEFSPARDFYALPDGRIVFFFPPSLMKAPAFDVPEFAFTLAELENLLQ